MVTRGELCRMAMRYDTSMGHAFRRALGLFGASVAAVARRTFYGVGALAEDAYDGLSECFRNLSSPMDRLR